LYSVGDVVDVLVDKPSVGDWSDAWNQGVITHVRDYKAGPVYTVQTFDGKKCVVEQDSVKIADK
jgi:hypothetical protein